MQLIRKDFINSPIYYLSILLRNVILENDYEIEEEYVEKDVSDF